MSNRTADGAAQIKRRQRRHRHSLKGGAADYRVVTDCPPINRYVEISGPAEGIRWLRRGSPDFSSFAELAKSLVVPGMSDLEKALAVYRFSNRCATHGGMGWGNTEMTRFLNAFGYSFCWGQADFQHLLYEAVGLTARAPGLKGHSSVEVLIDGRWCMLDAYMQLLLPSPDLAGLATGQELMDHPWIFAAARGAPERVAVYQDYWSRFVAGNTYEPWQDSRRMVLNLRRRETLRFDYDRREVYCVAPGEPPDYVNGEWRWHPRFDDEHLATEVDLAVNIVAAQSGLSVDDPARPARLEYRIRSPYPLCTGSMRLSCAGAGEIRVTVSTDARRTWAVLHDGAAAAAKAVTLSDHLSPATLDNIGQAASEALIAATVCEVVVRFEFGRGVVIRDLGFSFLVQANAASLPKLDRGVNQWQLISGNPGNSIVHVWDEFPEFRISNRAPYVGEQVALSLTVHNPTGRRLRRVPVQFVLAGTDVELARVVIPEIAARGSAVADANWVAEIVPDRTDGYTPGTVSRYVRSIVEARLGDETSGGEYSGIARGELTVRARPQPRIDDRLLWSSETCLAHERRIVLRAAVVNDLGRDADSRLTYLPDAPLSVTLTPYLGDPDAGGQPLAAGVHCRDILPSEFAVAEWTLPTASLPATFDFYIVASSACPVAPSQQRLLAHRRVRVRAAAVRGAG